MGLDQYLEAECHLVHYGFGEQPESEEHRLAREVVEKIGLPADNAGEGNYGMIEITVQAGYWRKANHIHKWFVDNVQDGVDECQRSYASREKLTELRDVCQRVLAASELVPGPVHVGTQWTPQGGREEMIEIAKVIKDASLAQELLPTGSGFFFGSIEYDEWYYHDIEHTVKVVDACLASPDNVDFYYQASW